MKKLKNESIIITGASSGIGEATAKRLALEDAALILIARREEKLQKVEKEILSKNKNAQILLVVSDVSDVDFIVEKIKSAPAPFQSPTVLVNNAGLAIGAEPFQYSNREDWDEMFNTNIRAVTHLTHAFLPDMIERKKGHIVQLGSVAGRWPYKGGHVYCGTKAFVRQFSMALRTDLLGTGIKVTDIEPGIVETEFSEVRYKGDKEKADAVYKDFNSLNSEDIAETVAWVLSQPPHVNVTMIEIMPTDQALAGFSKVLRS